MKRLLVALLLIASCKKAEMPIASTETAAVATTAATKAPEAKLVPRMVIRNATIAVVVKDPGSELDKLVALAEQRGGYVSDSKRWKEGEQIHATATLRVPAAQLFPILATIRGSAVRVQNENVSSDDVSQAYTDLGSQLTNLQATETELRELLKTIRERTQKAAEVLEIYAEVARVRGEIDRVEGRMKYLSQMSAMSTIAVDLIPDVVVAPVVEPGWQPLVTVRAATRALLNALEALTDLAIWAVIYFLPMALLFVAAVLIVRLIWIRLQPQRSA